jgi:hypothetical protein
MIFIGYTLNNFTTHIIVDGENIYIILKLKKKIFNLSMWKLNTGYITFKP